MTNACLPAEIIGGRTNVTKPGENLIKTLSQLSDSWNLSGEVNL